ncbi:MAG: 3-phosphoshikimate 1-carboxyvinyltransferase, partial [Gemmatimonadota bacterium]|nr:3-phosphoshikimate 1-carboxyvinyltransferase [Gemmatimonadota bacterium]
MHVAGTIRVPGDKSISHRVLLFAAMARGTTRIGGLLTSLDARSSA